MHFLIIYDTYEVPSHCTGVDFSIPLQRFQFGGDSFDGGNSLNVFAFCRNLSVEMAVILVGKSLVTEEL